MSIRKFVEHPMEQGAEEIIAYKLTTTPWGSTPTSPTVKLYSLPDLTDVSSTKLSGTASVTGDIITTPLVTGLAADTRYRLEIKFVSAGNTFEAWGEIICRR